MDVENIIYTYLTQLKYNDVLCELKQRFLHDRMIKEIFYNKYDIITRFVYPLPIVEDNFMTRGEEDIECHGYGDDRYMEDYFDRFEDNFLAEQTQMLYFPRAYF